MMTKKAISLVKQSLHQLNVEIFVIDNASKDNSVALVTQAFPDVTLISNHVNVGFGRANNQVLSMLTGRYVLLLNTDAFVESDTIQKTFDFMQAHPSTGILGVKLLGDDASLQPSCRYFPTPWNLFLNRTALSKLFISTRLVDDMNWDHVSVRKCDWVPGCYYLIRKEVIDQVGLFDPRYFLYYEEVDHCFATKKAGWEVVYYPDAPIVHIGGESAKTDNKLSKLGRQVSALQIESELLYFRKNLGLIRTISHLMLSTLAELILLLKRALKSRFNIRATFGSGGLCLMWKLFFLTRAGNKPLH